MLVLWSNYELQVYYGAYLENRVLGIVFSKWVEMLTENTGIDQYIAYGWSLNKLTHLYGYILSF